MGREDVNQLPVMADGRVKVLHSRAEIDGFFHQAT